MLGYFVPRNMDEATVGEGTVTPEVGVAVADISPTAPITPETIIREIGWSHNGGTAAPV